MAVMIMAAALVLVMTKWCLAAAGGWWWQINQLNSDKWWPELPRSLVTTGDRWRVVAESTLGTLLAPRLAATAALYQIREADLCLTAAQHTGMY